MESTAALASIDVDDIRVDQDIPHAHSLRDDQPEPILPTPRGNAPRRSDSSASSVSDKKNEKHKTHCESNKTMKGQEDATSENADTGTIHR